MREETGSRLRRDEEERKERRVGFREEKRKGRRRKTKVRIFLKLTHQGNWVYGKEKKKKKVCPLRNSPL